MEGIPATQAENTGQTSTSYSYSEVKHVVKGKKKEEELTISGAKGPK